MTPKDRPPRHKGDRRGARDEGEEVITPNTDEIFGSYDLNEAARYVFFVSNHIQKGGSG